MHLNSSSSSALPTTITAQGLTASYNSTYVPWAAIINRIFYDPNEPVPLEYRILNLNWTDVPLMLVCAAILFFLRRLLGTHVFRPMATRWKVTESEIPRFVENAWFTFYHPSIVIMGIICLYSAPWFWGLDALYYDFPQGHLNDLDPVSGNVLLKPYAIIGCAFYIQAIFGLVFVDERMKDFVEMLVHHFSTIVLIFLSVFTMHHRVGSIILILHDFVDIFLYSAKLMHSARYQLLANVFFFAFTVSFLVLRLVLFPYIVYGLAVNPNRLFWPSTHFLFRHVPNVAWPLEVSSYGICVNRYCVSTYHFLNGLLFVLIALHIYWFALILKLLIRTLSAGGNVPGDIRQKKNKKQDNMEGAAANADVETDIDEYENKKKMD